MLLVMLREGLAEVGIFWVLCLYVNTRGSELSRSPNSHPSEPAFAMYLILLESSR